jgi:hypothetical protein
LYIQVLVADISDIKEKGTTQKTKKSESPKSAATKTALTKEEDDVDDLDNPLDAVSVNDDEMGSDVSATIPIETEEQYQDRTIKKIMSEKKNAYKIMTQKQIFRASEFTLKVVWKVYKLGADTLLQDAIDMVLTICLKITDSHPNYQDYHHDSKKIVSDGIAYRRAYATRLMKRKLKRKL